MVSFIDFFLVDHCLIYTAVLQVALHSEGDVSGKMTIGPLECEGFGQLLRPRPLVIDFIDQFQLAMRRFASLNRKRSTFVAGVESRCLCTFALQIHRLHYYPLWRTNRSTYKWN